MIAFLAEGAAAAAPVADAVPGLPAWLQQLLVTLAVLAPLVAKLLHSHLQAKKVIRALAKTALELTDDPADAKVLEKHAEAEGVGDHPEVKRVTAAFDPTKIDEPKKP